MRRAPRTLAAARARARPRPRRASRTCTGVSGSLTIFEPSTSSSRERLAPPRVRVQRAVVERLGGDLGERRLADPVLGHVALDLHREELRREHQAGLAVPGADAPLLGQRVERARRVLVEADDERDLGRAGGEHRVRGGQRRAAGRAAVLDVDERHAGEAEHRDRGVGVAGGVRAAGGEVDVLPADAGVARARARAAIGGHLEAGHARVAAERVDAEADDGDVVAHSLGPPPAGRRTSARRRPGRRDQHQLHRHADPQPRRDRTR